MRPRRLIASLITIALAGAIFAEPALAQITPFGPRPASPPAPSGFGGWLLSMQALYYRELMQAVRAASQGAALGLLGLSFLYGIFHAAGPGHGKAVISSYLLADGSTFRRGIALTVASSLLQAIVAVALVGVLAIALGATARAMDLTVRVLELGSYALIVAFGLYLTWQKGRAFLSAWRSRGSHDHHSHNHHHHAHDHDHHGHTHGPEPAELKGKGWLRRGITAVLAVGARPCSGAILILVFTLSQGIFWVGVVATFVMALGTAITVAAIASLALVARGLARRLSAQRAGGAMLALQGLELAGALFIVAFGALLITGMVASERLLPA